MAILAPCPGVVGSVRVDSFDQASIAVGNGSRGCAGTNPKLIADLALSHRIATAKVAYKCSRQTDYGTGSHKCANHSHN